MRVDIDTAVPLPGAPGFERVLRCWTPDRTYVSPPADPKVPSNKYSQAGQSTCYLDANWTAATTRRHPSFPPSSAKKSKIKSNGRLKTGSSLRPLQLRNLCVLENGGGNRRYIKCPKHHRHFSVENLKAVQAFTDTSQGSSIPVRFHACRLCRHYTDKALLNRHPTGPDTTAVNGNESQ